MVHLLRQFGEKAPGGGVGLDEIDGDGDGAAAFGAVDVELFLAAPLLNGVGDEVYLAVVEGNERLEQFRALR